MRVRLIPKGRKLIKLSLFYWLTYTLSVILFTAIATILSLIGVSQIASFVVAFSLSSFLLISLYIRRFRYTQNRPKDFKTLRVETFEV